MSWLELKEGIEAVTGLERDALHIYAALLIQIGAAFILRSSLANVVPWLCAVAAEIGNELLDMLYDGRIEGWELEGGAHDLWNTLLIPTTLLLLARYAPALLAPGARAGGGDGDAGGEESS